VRGDEKMVVPVNNPSRHKDRKESPVTSAATRQPAEKALTPPAMPAQKPGDISRKRITPKHRE